MEKWNNRYVSSPPVYYYSKQDHTVKRDTSLRMSVCVSNLAVQLSHQTFLEEENFYLKRVIYKLNNQQRREKTFAYLQLIQKCLQRYLDVNLCSTLNSLSTDVQRTISDIPDSLNYLPSQQTLQYYMVKLMGGAGLLAQIMMYCNQILTPIRQQMYQRHFVDKNLLFLSIISRIWVISNVLLYSLQIGYNQMFPILQKFPANPHPWLNEDEELPKDLEKWIWSNWPGVCATPTRVETDSPEAGNGQVDKQDEEEQGPLMNTPSILSHEEDIGVLVKDYEANLKEENGEKPQKTNITCKMKFDWIMNAINCCRTSTNLASIIRKVKIAMKLWPKKTFPGKLEQSIKRNLKQAVKLRENSKPKKFHIVKKKTVQTIEALLLLGLSSFRLPSKRTKFINQLLDMWVRGTKMLTKSIKSLKHQNKLHLGPVVLTLDQNHVNVVIWESKKFAHLSMDKKIKTFKDDFMSLVDCDKGLYYFGRDHTIDSSKVSIEFKSTHETEDLDDYSDICLPYCEMKFDWIMKAIKCCKTSSKLVSIIKKVQLAMKLWPKTTFPRKLHQSIERNALQAQNLGEKGKPEQIHIVIEKTVQTIEALSLLGLSSLRLSSKNTKFINQLLDMWVRNKKKFIKSRKYLKHQSKLHLGSVLLTIDQNRVNMFLRQSKKVAHLSVDKEIQTFKDDLMSLLTQDLQSPVSHSSDNAELDSEDCNKSLDNLGSDHTIDSSNASIEFESTHETEDLDESVDKSLPYSREKRNNNSDEETKENEIEPTMQETNLPILGKNMKKTTLRKKLKRGTMDILKPKKNYLSEERKELQASHKNKLKQKLKKHVLKHTSKGKNKLKRDRIRE